MNVSIRSARSPSVLDAGTSSWDALLDLQTELYFPHEVALLLAAESWVRARRVLDIGCGNGRYLKRLQQFASQKQFVGIDVSSAMIDIAQTSEGGGVIEFAQADFYSYAPHELFDLAFMRLVLQHLCGVEPVLRRAAELVRPGGSLLVMEPNPHSFLMIPTTPNLLRLFQAVEAASAASGTNRARLSDLPKVLSEVSGWNLRTCTSVNVPSAAGGGCQRIKLMIHLWIDLLEAAGHIDFRFDDARSDVDAWAVTAPSFNQIGIQVVELTRL